MPVRLRFPVRVLAACCSIGLLLLGIAATAEPLHDERIQAGKRTFLRDSANAHGYYYLPTEVELSKKRGRPEFVFVKYADASNREVGGLVHFLVKWGLSAAKLEAAERALQARDKEARVLGPVPFKDGTFSLVMKMPLGDEAWEFTHLGTGKAPTVPGAKAAVSIVLGWKAAEALAATLGDGTSLLSVSFALNYEGLSSPFDAEMLVKWDKVSKHHGFRTGGKVTYEGMQGQHAVNLTIDKLRRTGAIEVNVSGQSTQGQAMWKTIYDHLTGLLTQVTGTADMNPAPVTPPMTVDRAWGGNKQRIELGQAQLKEAREEADEAKGKQKAAAKVAKGAKEKAEKAKVARDAKQTAVDTAKTDLKEKTEAHTEAKKAAAEAATAAASAKAAAKANKDDAAKKATATAATAKKTKTKNAAKKAMGDVTKAKNALAAAQGAVTTANETASGAMTEVTAADDAAVAAGTATEGAAERQSVLTKALKTAMDPPFKATIEYSYKKVKSSGEYRANLRHRLRTQREHRMDGNISGVDESAIKLVDLENSDLALRPVEVVLAGADPTRFGEFVNAVEVSFERGANQAGGVAKGDVVFDQRHFREGGDTRQEYTYARLGQERETWKDYRYRVRWDFFGGISHQSRWTRTDRHILPLEPPAERTSIAVNLQEDLHENDLAAVEVDLRSELFEKSVPAKSLLFDEESALSQTHEYVAEAGDLGFEYRVRWHYRDGTPTRTQDWKRSTGRFLSLNHP
ncbi:MAG: hypothetical protein JRH01_04675 [Deltaproteobacteria bacterium]|nr:hypothetical protein [Deltaproteobacteria bacterium]